MRIGFLIRTDLGPKVVREVQWYDCRGVCVKHTPIAEYRARPAYHEREALRLGAVERARVEVPA